MAVPFMSPATRMMPVAAATLLPATTATTALVRGYTKKGQKERLYSQEQFLSMLRTMFIDGTGAKKTAGAAGFPSAETSLKNYSRELRKERPPLILYTATHHTHSDHFHVRCRIIQSCSEQRLKILVMQFSGTLSAISS